MAGSRLLGPSELYTQTPPSKPEPTGDRFIDLMISRFSGRSLHRDPLLRDSDPCVDFFIQSFSLQSLELAWAHNPLTALKLIFNFRAVRGTGKAEKESFFSAALWLHRHHPKTLASNVPSFSDLGCFKDLPEVLLRLLGAPHRRPRLPRNRRGRRRYKPKMITDSDLVFQMFNSQDEDYIKKKRVKNLLPREIRVSKAEDRSKNEEEIARALRKKKWLNMAKKVYDRYNLDEDFRFLYEKISDHFADCLKSDLESLKAGELNKISLAAKWCPSIDSSYDRSTLLCESISRKMFPRELYYGEEEGLEEAHYALRVRNRLRKEVLVPLRKALELPEVFIGRNRWDQVQYRRVPSVAMRFYKEKFLSHDGERFQSYLEDVKSGKAKISAGALLPHEIVADCVNGVPGWDADVAELQWRRMVKDMAGSGKFRDCLPVVHPYEMSGTDSEAVGVALGLLISELSQEPWRGKLITYTDDPKLHVINGGDGEHLRSKIESVKGFDHKYNSLDPDIGKVFDVILGAAVEGRLREEEMIKRVVVLSCMEFPDFEWERDHDKIVRKFMDRGYSTVPEVVYWGLGWRLGTPVVEPARKGVAKMEGFSKNMMKMFVKSGGGISPLGFMESAVGGEDYQRLVVVD